MLSPVFDPIDVRYTGRFADDHVVDALEFSRSVSGISKVGNNLCHLLFFGELARSTKHKMKFYVRPIKENGVYQELISLMNDGMMPIFLPILGIVAKQFIELSFEAIIKSVLKKRDSSDQALEKLHQLAMTHSDVSKQVHEGNMQDKKWLRDRIDELTESNRVAIRAVPAPLGNSVNKMQIGTPNVGPTIDEAEAEVLRANDDMIVGETATFIVTVEGVFKSNGACRLKILETGQTVSGKITDPAVVQLGNVYTAALDKGLKLQITAKPTLKLNSISTLYVNDAKLVA
jgi:hypothetical protein